MTYISYIDGNSLYGSQMILNFPSEDYEFGSKNFIKTIEKLKKTNSHDWKNNALEADLEYPNDIHKHHKDFPMAQKRYKVSMCMIN